MPLPTNIVLTAGSFDLASRSNTDVSFLADATDGTLINRPALRLAHSESKEVISSLTQVVVPLGETGEFLTVNLTAKRPMSATVIQTQDALVAVEEAIANLDFRDAFLGGTLV